MEQISRETLPPGFDFAWAGQSLEEVKAGSQAIYIFALSLILVYLVLAAQYESWVLPFIILLGVPLAVIGGLGAQLLRGPCQRRLLPGRARHADRAGGQELHPDRRVRGAAPRARPADPRRRHRGRPHPAAAHPDDVVRLHPGRAPPGGRHRRRRGRPQLGRHVGGGRHARLDLPVHLLHPGALRGDPHPGSRARCAARPTRPRSRRPKEPPMSERLRPALLAARARARGAAPRGAAVAHRDAVERVTFEEAVRRAPSSATPPWARRRRRSCAPRPCSTRREGRVPSPRQRGRRRPRSSTPPAASTATSRSPGPQTAFSGTASYPLLAASRWAAAKQAADQVGIARISAEEIRRQVALLAAESYLAVIAAEHQRDDRGPQPRHRRAPSRTTRGRAWRPARAAGSTTCASSQELRRRRGPDPGVGAGRAAGAGGARHRGLRRRPGGRGRRSRDRVRPRLPPTPDTWLAQRPDVRLLTAQVQAADRVVRDAWKYVAAHGDGGVQPAVRHAGRLLRAREHVARVRPAPGPDLRRHAGRQQAPPRRRAGRSPQLRLDAVKLEARSEVRFAQEAVARNEQHRGHDPARRRRTRARRCASPRSPTRRARPPTSRSCRPSRRRATPRSWRLVAEDRLRQARLDLLVALGQFP